MDYLDLCLCIPPAVLIVCLYDWIMRWWTTRVAKRLAARLVRDHAITGTPRLQPESRYVVTVSESNVSCRNPDGTIGTVEWQDLQTVDLITTDDGPFLPDVFWVLRSSATTCIVPGGATGESELLQRLQQLPGFRNDLILMSSIDNRRFVLWERSPAGEAPRPAPDDGARA